MGTKLFGRAHDEFFCDWHFTVSNQAQDVCIQYLFKTNKLHNIRKTLKSHF